MADETLGITMVRVIVVFLKPFIANDTVGVGWESFGPRRRGWRAVGQQWHRCRRHCCRSRRLESRKREWRPRRRCRYHRDHWRWRRRGGVQRSETKTESSQLWNLLLAPILLLCPCISATRPQFHTIGVLQGTAAYCRASYNEQQYRSLLLDFLWYVCTVMLLYNTKPSPRVCLQYGHDTYFSILIGPVANLVCHIMPVCPDRADLNVMKMLKPVFCCSCGGSL